MRLGQEHHHHPLPEVLINRVFGQRLEARNSTVYLTNSSLFGRSATEHAMVAVDSTITLSTTTLWGANGVMDIATCRVTTPPGPGLQAIRSTIKMEAHARIVGGEARAVYCWYTERAHSVDADQMNLERDAVARIVGDIRGTHTDRNVPLFAGLHILTGTSPGYSTRIGSYSNPGDLVFTFYALPIPGQTTPYGTLFMDLSTAVVVDAGMTNNLGWRQFYVGVGREFPLGITLMAQAVGATPAGIGLSAPAPLIMSNRTILLR